MGGALGARGVGRARPRGRVGSRGPNVTVVLREGLVGGAESAANGATDVRLEGMVIGEVSPGLGGPPGVRMGGRAAPPPREGRLIGWRGLVVLNGGESVGSADPLPAAASELLMSSSDEVGGLFFKIGFPVLDCLPFPMGERGVAPGRGRGVVPRDGRGGL